MKACIWVVEDDTGARFIYEELLGGQFLLQMFENLTQLREALERGEMPDVLVVDLRLPDGTFLDLLNSERWRSLVARFPFFVVSSVDDIEVLRFCYQNGAADYLTKPFGRAELLFKLEKVLTNARAATHIPMRTIVLDQTSLRVKHYERFSSELTSKEFQIMSYLVEQNAYETSKAAICDVVWSGMKISNKVFNVHLSNLRKKLAPIGVLIQFRQPNMYKIVEQVE